MTGPERDAGEDAAHESGAGRRATATVETTHPDAAVVAAALAPDNTAEMETSVVARGADDGTARGDGSADDADADDGSAEQGSADDGDVGDDADDGRANDADGGTERHRAVRTGIERGSAAGLRSTVDDYLVNVDVADRTVRKATAHTTRQ